MLRLMVSFQPNFVKNKNRNTMKKFELIRNAFALKSRIEYSKGSIVSQQLIYNRAGNITLFSFDKGQQLSEHTAPFDAVCQILEGVADIKIDGQLNKVREGEMIIMPANVPHSVFAGESFKMLLTMIKGN